MKKYTKKKETPKASVPVTGDALSPDDFDSHDMMEPKEPPRMTVSHGKKPAWSREIFQDTERYGSPEAKPFSSYVALMCDLADNELSCFEEE